MRLAAAVLPLALAFAAAAGTVAQAAPAAPAAPRDLVSGVRAWVTAVPDAATVAVRLELALGLDAEGEGSWGLAALALAALRDGPTRHLHAGEAVALAARAGLATTTALLRDRIAVTLLGPPEALPTALWLTAERLDPRELDPPRLAQLHATLVGATGHGPEPPPPPLQHTLANLFGPLGGHTAWASHQRAALDALEPLAAMVADALPRAHARVLVAAPPEVAAALSSTLSAALAPLSPREGGPPPRRDPSLDADWQATRPARVGARHDYDSRRLLTVAWDLRGLADRLRLPPERDEALRRALAALLGAPGGLLAEPLIDDLAIARDLEVRALDAPPALIVTLAARGRSAADARARLLDAVAALGTRGPPEALLLGARGVALTSLDAAWAAPTRRLELVSAWWAAGQAADPEAYHRALRLELSALRPRDLAAWAEYALHESRRVVVELTPTNLPDQERVVLDAETLGDYVRVLVDLRCPPPGRSFELVELLATKYGLTPDRYVALTRVLAREPERMRELNHEAEQRCQEYRKLRAMKSARELVALHRAVACQRARLSDPAEREAALGRIFLAADLDPSVYLPLLAMGREDPALAPELARIDAECAGAPGPAAP